MKINSEIGIGGGHTMFRFIITRNFFPENFNHCVVVSTLWRDPLCCVAGMMKGLWKWFVTPFLVDSVECIKGENMLTQILNFVLGAMCKGFIQHYVDTCCDHDPDNLRFRMPAGFTRTDLFKSYSSVYHVERLKKSGFFAIIKRHFPDVSFSKVYIV